MKESTRRRLQALYDEAKQALAGGDGERALQRLKDIYEVDYTFNGIAVIVEASYMAPEHDWIAEF
ncbi:MAG: hypothetical protein ABJF10_15155 [Chthoniobacter sp.]|uniref:hypothetical protein n=1 Tax=Chthoniobacter sp. TaxID=2510640 RepID=UPI0032AE7672